MRTQTYASVNVEQKKLMTVSEVATFLKVSHNTVRALTDREELHCYRVGGRNERRFSIKSLQAYLERHGSNGYQFTQRKFTNAGKAREPVPAYSSTAILNQGLHVHDWYLMPESYSMAVNMKGTEVDGKPLDKRAPSCAVLLLGVRRRWIGILFLLRLVRGSRDRRFSIEQINKTAPHKLLFPFLVSPTWRHIISLKNV